MKYCPFLVLLLMVACFNLLSCDDEEDYFSRKGDYDEIADKAVMAVARINSPGKGNYTTPEEGMATYGDTVVIFNSSGYYRMFNIYGNSRLGYKFHSISNGELASFRKDNHANNAFFSDEFYEEGDALPLIYVSSWQRPQRCFVERWNGKGFEHVHTITYSPSVNPRYYSNFAFDRDRRLLYNINYRSVHKSDELHVASFAMPSFRSDSVVLDETQAADTFTLKFPMPQTWQGVYIHEDEMFILYGGGTGVRGFYKVDLSTHDFVNYDFTPHFDVEPEALAYFNHSLIMNTNGAAIFYLYRFNR